MADKAFASLSSGLLARKGAAKPAMRPQGFGSFGSSLEDLGWNDMGQPGPVEEHVPTPAAGLTPSPQPRTVAVEPVVLEQQRAIEETFAPAPVPAPVAAAAEPAVPAPAPAAVALEVPAPASVVQMPRRRTAPLPAKAKAAFTLRLDPERHFKLRLACALTGRSAQQLVTGALDDFLNSLPEVEALAERMPVEAAQRSR